jgi:hypothetical protein
MQYSTNNTQKTKNNKFELSFFRYLSYLDNKIKRVYKEKKSRIFLINDKNAIHNRHVFFHMKGSCTDGSRLNFWHISGGA